jgi:uracil-DNA glycosylase family 4
MDRKREALQALYEDYEDCDRCPLSRQTCGRTNVVFGSGNPDADVMVISDYPREEDDRSAVPFAPESHAGVMIDRILGETFSTSRDDVWIDHTVMCLPRKDDRSDRPPKRAEIVACQERLHAAINIVDPKVILLLGATPLRMAKKWADPWDKELAAFREGITSIARSALKPRLSVEVQGLMGPVRYEARATFHPKYLLRLTQAENSRPGGDNYHSFKTWETVFGLADMTNYLYRGEAPYRAFKE